MAKPSNKSRFCSDCGSPLEHCKANRNSCGLCEELASYLVHRDNQEQQLREDSERWRRKAEDLLRNRNALAKVVRDTEDEVERISAKLRRLTEKMERDRARVRSFDVKISDDEKSSEAMYQKRWSEYDELSRLIEQQLDELTIANPANCSKRSKRSTLGGPRSIPRIKGDDPKGNHKGDPKGGHNNIVVKPVPASQRYYNNSSDSIMAPLFGKMDHWDNGYKPRPPDYSIKPSEPADDDAPPFYNDGRIEWFKCEENHGFIKELLPNGWGRGRTGDIFFHGSSVIIAPDIRHDCQNTRVFLALLRNERYYNPRNFAVLCTFRKQYLWRRKRVEGSDPPQWIWKWSYEACDIMVKQDGHPRPVGARVTCRTHGIGDATLQALGIWGDDPRDHTPGPLHLERVFNAEEDYVDEEKMENDEKDNEDNEDNEDNNGGNFKEMLKHLDTRR